MAMDSSLPHQFDFNEGVSLVVLCETQEEIDYYWEKTFCRARSRAVRLAERPVWHFVANCTHGA